MYYEDMSTNATIAMKNPDGSVTAIYNHYDGDTVKLGRLLIENYNTPEKISELLALGDVSSLGAELGEKHDFSEDLSENETRKNWSTFYNRDREEEDTDSQTFSDEEAFLNSPQYDLEFRYLYQNGVWAVMSQFESYGLKKGEWVAVTPELIQDIAKYEKELNAISV